MYQIFSKSVDKYRKSRQSSRYAIR